MEIYLELLADNKSFVPKQIESKTTEVCFEEFMIFLDGCHDIIDNILKLYLKSYSIEKDHYGCFYIEVKDNIPDEFYNDLFDIDKNNIVTKDPFNLSFALNNSEISKKNAERLKKYFQHNDYKFATGVAKLRNA